MKKLTYLIFTMLTSTTMAVAQLPALIPYRNAMNEWGYCNAQKQIIIPCQYTDAIPFANGVAWVQTNKLWGLINTKGQWVYPAKSDYPPDPFTKSLAVIKVNGSYGCINKAGKEVVPPIYNALRRNDNSTYIAVNKSGRWGIIDSTGKEIVPAMYNDAGPFYEGLASVKINGKWGFIDMNNKLVIPAEYDFVKDFNSGIAPVRKAELWGYINKTGQIVLPITYEWCEALEGGLGYARNQDGDALIDKTGKPITPFSFGAVYTSTNPYIIVRNRDERYGVIDRTGKVIVPMVHDDMGVRVTEGLVPTEQKGLWGFINLKNQWVIKPQYIYASHFVNGIAKVKMQLMDNTYVYGYIDKTGKKYWDVANDKPAKPKSNNDDDDLF
ncbi:MAG TPA: WG repeat-containing protein [Phnomibacter sp.]|nr:WG repeat-containing protein [Phnomibacter sp.]